MKLFTVKKKYITGAETKEVIKADDFHAALKLALLQLVEDQKMNYLTFFSVIEGE